jgi:hypothetical protein
MQPSAKTVCGLKQLLLGFFDRQSRVLFSCPRGTNTLKDLPNAAPTDTNAAGRQALTQAVSVASGATAEESASNKRKRDEPRGELGKRFKVSDMDRISAVKRLCALATHSNSLTQIKRQRFIGSLGLFETLCNFMRTGSDMLQYMLSVCLSFYLSAFCGVCVCVCVYVCVSGDKMPSLCAL